MRMDVFTSGNSVVANVVLRDSTILGNVLWRGRYRAHTFHDGRVQFDQPCPKCSGYAFVTSFFAPDKGRNWWQCEKCGHGYV